VLVSQLTIVYNSGSVGSVHQSNHV